MAGQKRDVEMQNMESHLVRVLLPLTYIFQGITVYHFFSDLQKAPYHYLP